MPYPGNRERHSWTTGSCNTIEAGERARNAEISVSVGLPSGASDLYLALIDGSTDEEGIPSVLWGALLLKQTLDSASGW